MTTEPDPSEAEPTQAVAWRAFMVAISLLVVGATVNVVWGIVSPPYLSGLRSHSSGALSALISEEQQTLRIRYGFEGFLHDYAAGGSIVVPYQEAVDGMLVENIAHLDIDVAEYDPETTERALAALPYSIRETGYGVVGEDAGAVRWRILMADSDRAERVVYFRVGTVVYIVDERLGVP